jgi:hypothetical protein
MKIGLPESVLLKLPARARWILCVLMVFACSACASSGRYPWLFQNAETRSIMHIDRMLTAFHNQKHRYPRDLAELQTFATRNGQPISLRPFSEIRVTPKSSDSVSVPYVTRSGQSGVLSIDPPLGVYRGRGTR